MDLSLSPVKRSAPSKGRRATNSATKQGFLDDDDSLGGPGSPLKQRPVSGELFLEDDTATSNRSRPPPPHGRRTGGWADENSRAKTAKSVRINEFGEYGIGGRNDSDEDDGPAIPDLDDVRDEDLAFQVCLNPLPVWFHYQCCCLFRLPKHRPWRSTESQLIRSWTAIC